ncbi:MAG: DNA polymerase III subunit delta' [Paracoccaceae bacterium]
MTDATPEPDAIEGAPHPRATARLIGQGAAESTFLNAYISERLHHGWLITGPRGVGKATLAWRIARFLLATPPNDGGMFAPPPPDTLDIPASNPIARRVAALSESRLMLVRRAADEKTGKLHNVIAVDDIRKLIAFFNMSAADGGHRVAIIDSADEMNPNAANALLKLLEEPPAKVTILLISHQPGRLLPTIRSRCRELRLTPLSATDLSDALTQAGGEVDAADHIPLAELAGGSVGEAFRLTNLDGLKLYAALIRLLSTLPRLDRPMALALAEAGAGRGAEAQFDLIVTLIDMFLARIARAGTLHALPPEAAKGEAALIERLAPTPDVARHWADLAQKLGIRARRGKAVNLDPAALLMDMVLKIDETAGMLAHR